MKDVKDIFAKELSSGDSAESEGERVTRENLAEMHKQAESDTRDMATATARFYRDVAPGMVTNALPDWAHNEGKRGVPTNYVAFGMMHAFALAAFQIAGMCGKDASRALFLMCGEFVATCKAIADGSLQIEGVRVNTETGKSEPMTSAGVIAESRRATRKDLN